MRKMLMLGWMAAGVMLAEAKDYNICDYGAVGDTTRLSTEAVQQAIAEGSKSETTGGNEADDTVHDVYLEEIERKK